MVPLATNAALLIKTMEIMWLLDKFFVSLLFISWLHWHRSISVAEGLHSHPLLVAGVIIRVYIQPLHHIYLSLLVGEVPISTFHYTLRHNSLLTNLMNGIPLSNLLGFPGNDDVATENADANSHCTQHNSTHGHRHHYRHDTLCAD